MISNITYVPSHFWFNYLSGAVKKEEPFDRTNWRFVEASAYPFKLDEIRNHIPNFEHVYLYKSVITITGKEIFYGYVSVRNEETNMLESISFNTIV